MDEDEKVSSFNRAETLIHTFFKFKSTDVNLLSCLVYLSIISLRRVTLKNIRSNEDIHSDAIEEPFWGNFRWAVLKIISLKNILIIWRKLFHYKEPFVEWKESMNVKSS